VNIEHDPGTLERGTGNAVCIAQMTHTYYTGVMKTLTVRLPESLVAQIDAESKRRNVTRSDVVRERLGRYGQGSTEDPLADIRHLIGSVHGLPRDLSSRKKEYLRAILRAKVHGRKRPR